MKDAKPIELIGKNGHYIFDPKHILSLNGRFGSVFRGTEIQTGKRVTVKFFNPQRGTKQAEFRFKMESVYNFGRSDIQDAIDFVSTENGYFLVKDFIPGISLKKTKNNQIALEDWKDGFICLLDTLAFLEEKGIVHGDIKPANIIWTKSNKEKDEPQQPVLLDFGLARLKGVQYNDALYSFVYSPPEQQLGYAHLMGVHSDLFSLGVTFYECITDVDAYDLESNSPVILEQAQLAMPLENRHELPKDWFLFFSYLCQKPAFKKPHTMYSQKDREQLILENIEKRPRDISKVKEMAQQLSIKNKGKSIWRIFG